MVVGPLETKGKNEGREYVTVSKDFPERVLRE